MAEGSKEHFYELLNTFRDAMLVTRGPDGTLRARPMALAQTERGGDLWFATSISSPKVDEISADAHVNVVLQAGGRYLSVSGVATVVRDRAKLDQLWNESWRAWFPRGKDDPDLVLLSVRASEGEFWDNEKQNRLVFAFEVAKAYVTGERPSRDKDLHDKVRLG